MLYSIANTFRCFASHPLGSTLLSSIHCTNPILTKTARLMYFYTFLVLIGP